MVECVWAITTYRRNATEKIGDSLWRGFRTVGLLPDKETAIELVEENAGDLEEAGYYQFAVVEPLPFGLYPVNDAEHRVWYEYDEAQMRWVRLEDLPTALKEERHIGGPWGPRDFTNWSNLG